MFAADSQQHDLLESVTVPLVASFRSCMTVRTLHFLGLCPPKIRFSTLQASLDFAPQLQLLMHLLLPSIQLSGGSLTGASGAAPSKEDLVRLQVAALQALREFIVYRCAPELPCLTIPPDLCRHQQSPNCSHQCQVHSGSAYADAAGGVTIASCMPVSGVRVRSCYFASSQCN